MKKLKQLSLGTRFSLVAVIALALGVGVTVLSSQQNQNTRSRAAGTGGTGNCATFNASVDDLISDDCTVQSGMNGSIFGSRNIINGGLNGNITGNDNLIRGGMNGTINGDRNEICGDLGGDINGNNNIIHGTLFRGGSDNGTGNLILPGTPCGSRPSTAPTITPTVTPTPTQGTCADGIDNNQNELIDQGDPACHTDGNQDNPNSYDPGRNEGPVTPTISSSSNLTCSTTPIVLSDLMRSISVTLKNSSGAVIPGKTISWSTTSSASITPTSSVTNSAGVATVNAGVTQLSTPSFTGTIVSNFAGDNTAGPATCSTPVSYTSTAITSTPTPIVTIPPGNTSIKLNLFLHGLGQGGDSANPNSGGNPNPLHPNRGVKVEVLNAQNQLVATKEGPINFNSAAGNFTGTIDLGSAISTGAYTVKVKTEQFLRTLVPGIQNLTSGQSSQLPATIMINGDINDDNTLNILDYNILMGCYSDLEPPVSCTAPNNILSDLDDDGDVNQFDYNLFLRELTNRAGQ